MLRVFVLAAAACLYAADAEKGYWINNQDAGFSIKLPANWNSLSHKLTPPGMVPIFFISPKSKVYGLDISADLKKEMDPVEYLDFMRTTGYKVKGAGKEPSLRRKKLDDGSQFNYFYSQEKKGKKRNYFMQGVLTKKGFKVYVTLSSSKRFPTGEEQDTLFRILVSLRKALITSGGRDVSHLKNAAVTNIAADGSTLKIKKPWKPFEWGYTHRSGIGTPLHAFRKGHVKAEIAFVGEISKKRTAQDMIDSLAFSYQKKAKGDVIAVMARLENGLVLHYVLVEHPRMDGERNYILEGFFKRVDHPSQAYYYVVAAPKKEIKEKKFESDSFSSLSILGTLKWKK